MVTVRELPESKLSCRSSRGRLCFVPQLDSEDRDTVRVVRSL